MRQFEGIVYSRLLTTHLINFLSKNRREVFMSKKATVRQPHNARQNDSADTLSSALVQQHRERMSKGKVAAFDLIIGLNMLGIEGRKLLVEYILLKRQGRGD